MTDVRSAKTRRINSKLILVTIWLVFTFSLAGWWVIFGLQQIEFLKSIPDLDASISIKLLHQHKMILWEGGILLLSLLFGGGALFHLVVKERAQSRKLKEFFATFSHELKTSLTSLRLQAESLQEEAGDSSTNPLLHRLLNDTVRLQIQLENSLFLANIEKSPLFIESLNLRQVISSFKEHWPEAKIVLEKNAYVDADHRALESILKNAVQNAIYHGGATQVSIDVLEEISEDKKKKGITLNIIDNGSGFTGDVNLLGQLFSRQTSRSGSGIGTYLIKSLSEKMDGEAKFEQRDGALLLILSLKGRLV